MLFSSSPKLSLSPKTLFVVPTLSLSSRRRRDLLTAQEGSHHISPGCFFIITKAFFIAQNTLCRPNAFFVVPTQEGPAQRAEGIASHISPRCFFHHHQSILYRPDAFFVVPTQEGPAIQLPTTQIFVPQHNKNNVFHFMQKGAVYYKQGICH